MLTRALGALIALAYLASALASGHWWDLPAADLLRFGGGHGPALAAGESWRLISAIFLHGGLLHLGFNLIALSDFGSALEQRFGRLPLLCAFLAAGVAGFFTSALWQPDDVSIGASGAIFGLLGWWAVAAWRLAEFLPAAHRRQRLITLLLIVGVALGFGFFLPGIDNAAHLGGMLVGAALGALGLRRPRALPGAALAVVLAAWAGTLAFPTEWADRHRESSDFAARYTAFAEEDRAIGAALIQLGEDSRSGRISDAQALEQLQNQLLPRLAAQARRMETPIYRNRALDRERARWAEYAQLRQQAVEAVHSAVTGHDPMGLARFERLMQDAARIARDPAQTAPERDAP